MRILLDESVPRGLREFLPQHEVRTVAEQGWKGHKNGTLLDLAQERFDILVTADRGFEFEQNVQQFEIGVLILVAPSNRLVDYEPLRDSLQATVSEIQNGEVVTVAAEPGE